MKKRSRIAPGVAALPAAVAVACRAVPRFAALWQRLVSLPALRALHRLSAASDAPVLEIAAVLLAALALAGLAGRRPLRALLPPLAAAAIFLLLWYPAYWASPAPVWPQPDAPRLERLCAELGDALADSPSRILPVETALRQAGSVAGLPEAAVKRARRPEWMRALRVAGLFSPWTGEAILAPDLAPALAPFTAVHELMHLRGIADEGAANIAAWRRCVRAGGAFADSARLWALRYALDALNRIDPESCLRAIDRVDASLRALCQPAGRASAPSPLSRLCSALGIGHAASSYDALIAWLCAGAQRSGAASLPASPNFRGSRFFYCILLLNVI